MEKIKFGTGGQPVALEDLELLQNNAQILALSVLESLTDAKTKQFLMRRASMTYQSLDGDRVKVNISGGVLVANGELYPFASTELTLSSLSAPVYVCVQKKETDVRRFENNENKACRVKNIATLSATPIGECYTLSSLKTLVELLREVLNIGGGTANMPTSANVEVSFKNGYSGSVKMSVVGTELVLSVDVKSEQSTWTTNEKGLVFVIKDANLANKFLNVRSAGFGTSGNTYLSYLDYTTNGAVFSTIARPGMLVEGYLPPTTPINTTFTIPN